jgi:DNA polymerase-4
VIADVLDVTGIQISAGIAPNRLVAKIASDLGKPAGFVAIGREDAAVRLAGHSVRIIPGIGPKTAERLAELGCRTLGELQALGEQVLVECFGPRHGKDLHVRAFLHDDSPVVVERAIKSRSTETTFDADVSGVDVLEPIVARMGAELGTGMRRNGIRARNVAIKVRLDDWTTVTRARTLPEPTDRDELIATTAVDLLRAYGPARPVRLVGVKVAAFSSADGGAAPEIRDAAPAQLALPL